MINPMMYFDMAKSKPLGYINFELFADKVLNTAENICTLSPGENGFG